MGYVYNNHWEAFCKTYLEMNGYFVTNNLYAALVAPDEYDELLEQGLLPGADDRSTRDRPDRRTTRIEADLVAYRLPNTDLNGYPCHERSEGAPTSEFFAGDGSICTGAGNVPQDLLYIEVRANLSLRRPEQQIETFFRKGSPDCRKVERMTEILGKRFGQPPSFVVMAHSINLKMRKSFETQSDWKYTEFRTMFSWMQERMESMYEVKKRVQYNDPVLEMLRYLAREKLTSGG